MNDYYKTKDKNLDKFVDYRYGLCKQCGDKKVYDEFGEQFKPRTIEEIFEEEKNYPPSVHSVIKDQAHVLHKFLKNHPNINDCYEELYVFLSHFPHNENLSGTYDANYVRKKLKECIYNECACGKNGKNKLYCDCSET